MVNDGGGLVTERKWPRLVFVGVILVILAGIGVFGYFKYTENRQIPESWITYKNIYYGYAFKYRPDILVAPNIYGSREGEDLGVIVHSRKDSFPINRNFERGERLDKTVDKWYFEIDKPVVGKTDKMLDLKEGGCKSFKTNSGLNYYECIYDQVWSYYIFLEKDSSQEVYVNFNLDPINAFDNSDRLLIRRMVNSFSVVGENIMKIYPSKEDLKSWMKMYWCDKQNKFLEDYSNGIKQYSRNSVMNSKGVIDTIYLTHAKSYCDVPVEQMPFLPTTDCPYPVDESLGESMQTAICIGELPTTSYEATCSGMMALWKEELKKVPLAAGWKYFDKSVGGEVIAVPPQWQAEEVPIKSCNPEMVQIRNPKMEVVVTLGKDQMRTKNSMSGTAVDLVKFECGKYAICNLIREKTEEDYQYEYYLLLLNQPNIIAKPNRITVKFYDSKNEAKLMPIIDKMALSVAFLYEEKMD